MSAMPFDPLGRESIRVKAPAKLNLALAVAPPDDTGFHPIASWMTPIDLADELTLTRLDEGDLSRYAINWRPEAPVQSPIDWSITKDLAVRAHLALEAHLGCALPVQLRLDKRIPVGGGLGGGSSDAAAMLRALRALFSLNVTDDELAGLARTLGSDVGFFLGDGPALVQGLGELVERTPRVSLPGDEPAAVLVLPPFGCHTGSVYRAFDARAPGDFRAEQVQHLAKRAELTAADLFNDLAEPAERVQPDLAEIRARAAHAAGHPVHVTGSGSTLFVAAGLSEAPRIAAAVQRELTGCRVLTVGIV